jgi:hypothetical protein
LSLELSIGDVQMAVISIESAKKRTQAGRAGWSRWKPASAALAALSIGCSDQPGTYNSSCYTAEADSGTACLCNADGGVSAGMFDDAGSCLPAPAAPAAPMCPADPNPSCAQQSVAKKLDLDGGASSTLTIGDFTITLDSTYQMGSTYGASISLADFCGNVLALDSITIGAPRSYTENFGNIVISVDLNQVDTADPQWAMLTATMSCPYAVQIDGGAPSSAVCMNATDASSGGNIYAGSKVDIGGYGFTYAGDSAGFANILVTCDGATLASLQCTVGVQTVLPRPMDNGGRTITITANNAYLQYADVEINIQ